MVMAITEARAPGQRAARTRRVMRVMAMAMAITEAKAQDRRAARVRRAKQVMAMVMAITEAKLEAGAGQGHARRGTQRQWR